MKRAGIWAALPLAVLPLAALVLYWPGWTSWFQKDDFAWLGLYQMIHRWQDLGTVFFHPYAQGTIRTLSERIPYTLFRAAFGLDPLPFRCLAFLTFAAITIVLKKVCTGLTGSPAAGFWAATFWMANGAVAPALFWSAIYYELLCALIFLAALCLLMRYAATGDKHFYVAQWIVYLLGFGVLEQNVVYPALAAVYALCCARHVLSKVLPMFIPAAVYAVWHLMAAPLQTAGPYRMHWDASVFATFWMYWKLAIGPTALSAIGILASKARSAVAVLLTVGLLGFLIAQLARRRWIAGFFAAWFVIVLAPLLPLRDHIMSYYLTIPLVGFAMWAGWAVVEGWRAGLAARFAALLLAMAYLTVGLTMGRATAVAFHREAAEVHQMLDTVVAQARARGADRILLRGVTVNLWASALTHRPLRLYGFEHVYLVGPPTLEAPYAPANELPNWMADPRTVLVDVTPWAR